MKEIVGIVRKSEQGMSSPFLCRADDNELYWCKGALSGMTTLRAEWICANMAKVLQLPIPPFEIMHVDYELARESKVEFASQFVSPMNCYVFASKHIDNAADLMKEHLKGRILDAILGVRILLFDGLIHNTDRSIVNSNILSSKDELWIIDHNNAFSSSWDEKEFLTDHIFGSCYMWAKDIDYSDFLSLLQSPDILNIVSRCWAEMPSEWIDAEDGLTLDAIMSTIRAFKEP